MKFLYELTSQESKRFTQSTHRRMQQEKLNQGKHGLIGKIVVQEAPKAHLYNQVEL